MNEGLASLLLPAMIIILLGFMFWSQRRRQTAVATLQSSLAVGDDILTTSGLFGRITALDEITATLEVAPGTVVRFDRRAIATKVDTAGRPITGVGGQLPPDPTPSPSDPSDAPRTDPEK
jgi:preprotein translocase subunit YajC